jgi:hypothetical protein
LEDNARARDRQKEIRKFLSGKPGLSKFLRNTGQFKRQDLEEILNMNKDMANGVVNHLWDARMVRKEYGFVKVEPVLHEILREVTND